MLEAREAAQARGATSLSAPARGTGDDALSLADTLGHQDDGLAGAEHRATLSTLGRGLTAREREILRLRFEEDLTQAKVGERIGLSQMHVSRILRDTDQQAPPRRHGARAGMNGTTKGRLRRRRSSRSAASC